MNPFKTSIRHLREWYVGVLSTIRSRITRPQFIMLVAVMAGLASGLTAVLLKTIVHFIQRAIAGGDIGKLLMLLLPTVGLLACVFIVRKFWGGQLERGIAMVLQSIAGRSSYIPTKHTYAHVVTSSVTVGLGGSVGLEAPIVATGSAIGSTIARWSELNYQERTLMIACGAAAGISAVFNAPIAGVIFAVEVLLAETVVSYFIPLIISSVVGVLCNKMILQEGSLFNFVLRQNFDYHNVPFYITLGLLCGFCSLYYARMFKSSEAVVQRWKLDAYVKAVFGGLLLMAMYFILPPLFGEGYGSVKLVANNSLQPVSGLSSLLAGIREEWQLIVFSLLIVLLKPVAAGVTIGSGGNGGNFAPSLFTGSFLGYFFSQMFNASGWVKLPVGNFSLVGMAGVLAGVMYSPLTAIFLIAELTNGYELFIPLMIVSSLSFFIVKSYEPYSMDIRSLAMQGRIFTHKKEQNILTAIKLDEMLMDTYPSICIDKKLRDVVEMVKGSEKNVYAVHDQQGRLSGIIELNDVKQKLFLADQYDKVSVKMLMKKPAELIRAGESMQSVMDKFDHSGSWYLPVLDGDKRFVGFISKTKLFNKYREILSSQTDLYE